MQPISTVLLRSSGAAAIVFAAMTATGAAATLCVAKNPAPGCPYRTIGAAVAAAAVGDTIRVRAGQYAEDVHIQKPLSLIGAGIAAAIINAKGRANGVFIDGIGNSGQVTPGKNTLGHVTVTGFTVKNANFEGILVANASYVTLWHNHVTLNDRALNTSNATCPGIPPFETEEGRDCGEGVHLTGVDHATVAANIVDRNSGGILISDDTGPTNANVVEANLIRDNVFDCGITLASHPPAPITGLASSSPSFGVYENTITGNQSTGNGVATAGEGAGVGLFAGSPGNRTFGNVVVGNFLTKNGLPGVTIHNHVAKANIRLANNVITGNFIAGNGGDDEIEGPGKAVPTGIGLLGTTAVTGTMITANQISGEAIDIAINNARTARAVVSVHLNELLGRGNIGIANFGPGPVDATQNWWGCNQGPGAPGCTTVSGANVTFQPFLRRPVGFAGLD